MAKKDDIKEWRKRDGLTQQQLAELLGISRVHLNQIENGMRTPSPELLKNIYYFLAIYNPEKKLEILFDYVRIRFPTTDADYIMEEILGIRLKYVILSGHAFYGYGWEYVMGDIVLMFSDDEKLGCLLELKGKGCRQFEVFLEAQERSWYDFFEQVRAERGVLKRIDLAIDDKKGLLDISALSEKCKKKEYVSLFRSYRSYLSGELIKHREEEKECMGSTLYLGSVKSDIYFCIYEKDYEQYVKTGQLMEEADVKNRFEIRLKERRAEHAVTDLLEYKDVGGTAFAIINHYVKFLKPEKNDERLEWELDDDWKRFIGEVDRALKLTDKPEPYTLERTLKWIRRQVAPSFKMLRLYSAIRGEDDMLEKMIDEARLSSHQKMLLRQQQTEVAKMLGGRYQDFNMETGELIVKKNLL